MGFPFSSDVTRRPSQPGYARPAAAPAPPPARSTFDFKAQLDLAELDDRGRPGAVWNGQACEISRGNLVFRSRRLCYECREVLVAVHLVDDRPMPLYGFVAKSEYDGDGLYKTTLNLVPLPQNEHVQAWLTALPPRL